MSVDVAHSVSERCARAGRDVITQFRDEDQFLSNFSAHPVRWQDITYPTAEAAFHAGKTLDPALRALIAAAPSPTKAKQLGRTVPLRPGWDEHGRHTVMREVLAAKFTDPDLAARLVATGTALLVEGNTWCDQFWGCCTCPRHQAVPGQNWLGRHLMRLRTSLAPADMSDRWVRVACTGHQPHLLPAGCQNWLDTELRRIAGKLIAEHGTEVAISGAAAGADVLWAETSHAAGARVHLYQPYPGHDARWDTAWRDRLTAIRATATRTATLGSSYSVEVLHARSDWMIRDCDALIAVIDPAAEPAAPSPPYAASPELPVIHVDVHHRRTTIGHAAAA